MLDINNLFPTDGRSSQRRRKSERKVDNDLSGKIASRNGRTVVCTTRATKYT